MASAAVSRPYSSMEARCSPRDYETATAKVGDFTLGPGITRDLENFYLKAKTPADRARCLELITALENSQASRYPASVPRPPSSKPAHHKHRRPASAMPAMESTPGRHDPYTTTYKREYHAQPATPVHGDRPRSTCRAYQTAYQLNGPVGNSTYHNEFYGKPALRAAPVRSGTSSGNRRNNPHPLESFMVWKLPQKMKTEAPHSEWATPLTDDLMDKVCRGQLSSTYQNDFLGIPQGIQNMGSAFGPQKDWKSNVNYTLDSSTRRTYQQPVQQPELQSNVSRYGCNKKKHVPANGAVPTVSERQLHLMTRTTYEREFNEPGQQLYADRRPQNVRELERTYGAQALGKHWEAATGDEKEDMAKMLTSMNLTDQYRSPSSTSSVTRHKDLDLPPTGCLREVTPNWMSNHNGPVQDQEIDV